VSIITLTTDFGLQDAYVAALKGGILGIAPECQIVDDTHEISPQKIVQGAFVLAAAAPYFPPQTIHVAVVDPGGGSERALLAAKADEQYYLAPDNGLLSLILQSSRRLEVRRLENQTLWAEKISSTFRGRDVLAPTAAHLAQGFPFEQVGSITQNYVTGDWLELELIGGALRARIIYCDRFGNLATNLSAIALRAWGGDNAAGVRVRHRRGEITGLRNTYADVTEGEPLLLVNSAGYLEIAVRAGSASRKLHYQEGDLLVVDFPSASS